MHGSMKYITQGKLKPIRPVTFFDAADISQAFGHMQTGRHIGKVAIRMPEDPSVLPVLDSPTFFTLPPNRSFILIGGLGGLGRTVATWMVEKGARDFVFLSRSGGSTPDSVSFIKELESQDCSVTTIRGSVESMQDVRHAVAACKHRIGGVIQMSMVLRVG